MGHGNYCFRPFLFVMIIFFFHSAGNRKFEFEMGLRFVK